MTIQQKIQLQAILFFLGIFFSFTIFDLQPAASQSAPNSSSVSQKATITEARALAAAFYPIEATRALAVELARDDVAAYAQLDSKRIFFDKSPNLLAALTKAVIEATAQDYAQNFPDNREELARIFQDNFSSSEISRLKDFYSSKLVFQSIKIVATERHLASRKNFYIGDAPVLIGDDIYLALEPSFKLDQLGKISPDSNALHNLQIANPEFFRGSYRRFSRTLFSASIHGYSEFQIAHRKLISDVISRTFDKILNHRGK